MSSVMPSFDDDVSLHRNSAGQLVLQSTALGQHMGVVPVRAFPVTAAAEGLSLVGADGRELLWVARLADLPPEARDVIEQELAAREFMPRITRLRAVSTFSTPSVWEVSTDRGETRFVLKGEEDIRRLGDARLLITSEHGVQFTVSDLRALDRHSKRLLERFL